MLSVGLGVGGRKNGSDRARAWCGAAAKGRAKGKSEDSIPWHSEKIVLKKKVRSRLRKKKAKSQGHGQGHGQQKCDNARKNKTNGINEKRETE